MLRNDVDPALGLGESGSREAKERLPAPSEDDDPFEVGEWLEIDRIDLDALFAPKQFDI